MSIDHPGAEPADASRGPPPVSVQDSNHAHLRRATRPLHVDVDAHYTRLDLATRDGLGAFLLAQARAVPPLERAIEASGAAGLLGDWPMRRRAAALDEDLAGLALIRPLPARAPELPSRLHGMGALYVLEGAKLGGRVLLRQASTSPDAGVRAAVRFLGQFEAGGWRTFLATLNALPNDATSQTALVAGASAAFAMFMPGLHPDDPRAIRRPGPHLVQSDEA